jgi:drug/metabolite transporter (DMT)-like permease
MTTTISPALALRAANRRGIAAMSLGMCCFVSNDAIVKFVSASLAPSQLIFLRGLFATLLLLAVAHAMGATRQLADLLRPRVMQRALLDALATVTYLTSLFHLPIGNATAINMATPLFITLLAVLAWREKVGPGRWLAVVTGFTGVLLVVQPSTSAFNAYALLCLFGTVLHATRDLMTRSIDIRVPSILITVSTAVSVTLLAGVWSLFEAWRPMAWQHLALLGAASVFLGSGYYLLIISMRAGEMSVVAPFRYAGLLYALVLGRVVWGDVPNALAWAGIALLVGAGLYVLHSERSRARAALEPATD